MGGGGGGGKRVDSARGRPGNEAKQLVLHSKLGRECSMILVSQLDKTSRHSQNHTSDYSARVHELQRCR